MKLLSFSNAWLLLICLNNFSFSFIFGLLPCIIPLSRRSVNYGSSKMALLGRFLTSRKLLSGRIKKLGYDPSVSNSHKSFIWLYLHVKRIIISPLKHIDLLGSTSVFCYNLSVLCQTVLVVCSIDVFIAFTFFFSSLLHLCQIPSGAVQALERQKEFSDAIRNERDELRDEVVQLKDILKVLICVVKTWTHTFPMNIS